MHLNFYIPTCLRVVFEWQSRFFLHFPGTVPIISSIHPAAAPSGLYLIWEPDNKEVYLSLTSRSLHELSKEQVIAVFSAALRFPQSACSFLIWLVIIGNYSGQRQAHQRERDTWESWKFRVSLKSHVFNPRDSLRYGYFLRFIVEWRICIFREVASKASLPKWS